MKNHIVSGIVVAGCLLISISCHQYRTKEARDLSKFKSVSSYGQFAPPDAFDEDSIFAYYGAENEWNRRMFSERAASIFYKRRGQRELLFILDGYPDSAVYECTKWIAKEPQDQESLFVLTLAYCKKGDTALAYQTAKTALEQGIPFGRFLAGPRDILQPLYHYNPFRKMIKKKDIQIIHGPMLGDVTATGVRLWFRTEHESVITIKVYDNDHRPVTTSVAKSTAAKDYTAVISLDHLQPQTTYLYDILVDGVMKREGLRFTMFPVSGTQETLRVAFGGGAGYTTANEKIWNTILDNQPNALLLLGDNVYIDMPEMPGDFHQYTYYRLQSNPLFRQLVSRVPVYAIWDDHDAGTDDIWMGPYLNKPAWKMPTLRFFEENWNNPAYGTAGAPGCYFHFSMDDVDFIMLDCRFYRTNPFKEEKSMLGPVQKEWLKQSLLQAKGTFKFIVSSVPWSLNAKPGSRDTWAGFEQEREEIFDFIDKNKIEGVLLLSADRHRSDAWKIKRSHGYNFYEFESSKLTNLHTHEVMPEALFGYNKKCSFGLLEINTLDKNPRVIYKIVNIDGVIVDSLVVPYNKLTY